MSATRAGALAALVAVASCASDAQVSARFAPEMARAPRATVSVLGVLKAGRLSADAWLDLAPAISPSFGAPTCAAAFDAALVEKEPDLAAAIDAHARENGVSDALVGALARGADGDLVLVLETSGQLPTAAARHEETRRALPQAPPMPGAGVSGARGGFGGGAGGRRRGGSGFAAPPSDEEEAAKDALEISATVYSRALARSVGVVTLRYTGASRDEAVRRFSARLGAELAGARCVGWRTDARPTADEVRALRAE